MAYGGACAGYPAVISGFDISNYQGAVSVAQFQAAKAKGYAFVIIKCSEGTGYADPDFHVNWANAGAAGLARSAYHFAHLDQNSPQLETDWFVKCLGASLANGDGVAIDCEVSASGEIGPALHSMLHLVATATGVATPLAYTGNWFIPGHLDDSDLTDHPLWDAVYNSGSAFPNPVGPWAGHQIVVWQNADSNSTGIGGDNDLFNGTVADFQNLGKNGGGTVHMTWDINMKRAAIWPVRMHFEPWPTSQAAVDSYASQIADDGSNYETIITNLQGDFTKGGAVDVVTRIANLEAKVNSLPTTPSVADITLIKAEITQIKLGLSQAAQ